jgi:hypothetical protein
LKNKVVTFCVLGFLALQANAQLGGSTVFNAFNIPSSARVGALGGNLIAVKDGDLNLGIYNPALLDSNAHKSVSMSYVNYFAQTNFGFASYAHHLDSLGATVAATIDYFNYGQMTARDETGADIGEFSASDIALTLGIGMPIDTNFSVGANVKFIYSALAEFYAVGAAIDLGGTYHNSKHKFTAALLIKNLGLQLTTYAEGNREKLPFEMQLAISKRLRHAPFRFSIAFENLQKWDLTYTDPNADISVDPITGEIIEESKFVFGDKLMRHIVIGTEILLTKNIHLRAGYNYRLRQELKVAEKPGLAGISFGFGVQIKRFNLSYGRASYHIAEASNSFTVSTKF